MRIRSIVLSLVFVALGAVGLLLLWIGAPDISCGGGPYVRKDLRYIVGQLKRYKADTGHYPSAEDGLRAIPKLPQDPWGDDYIYRIPGTRHPNSYDLFSAGPDRRPDTADDYWGDD